MLKQIRYFQTVVSCGSFSKAAEKSFISQSAISQQIQKLERDLGVKLLNRENRRISLTPAGEYFYEQSLTFIADFDRLCKQTRQIEKEEDFILHIGIVKSYGGLEFQKAVSKFCERYPQIPIDVKIGNHEELYEWLKMDQVDLALSDQRRAFSNEYINLKLTEYNCNIEISVNNSLAKNEVLDVNDLKTLSCILISSSTQMQNEQNFYREIYGITSPIIFADNIEEARLMVISSKGYYLREGGSLPLSYSEIIKQIPLFRGKHSICRNYCAFWKVDNSGFYIEEFAEILKSQFNI